MADLIGQTLGHYHIIEQIGMGGMATVYKAYQANMDRYVAIKVLPRQLAEDPAFYGRFEQEARTIANLENKHILPVYDYGEQEGYTYLVMRYVGSGTLKDLTDRGALPLPAAAAYFSQIADALHYAHDHGVVHRDIKTSNVLIGEGQQCYLTDFGIAKLAQSSSHFTSTGSIIGTPAYMSPEQCSGLPADTRSDIYSLGIVLYEMLTGAVPFEAETPVAVVLMHVKDPLPSPRSANPAIPESVEKVLFRALAKDPDDRFQSAQDFAEALNTALETASEQPTAALPVPMAAGPVSPAPPPAAPTAPHAATTPLEVTRPPQNWRALAVLAVLAVIVAIVSMIALHGGGEESGGTDSTRPAAGEVTGEPAGGTPGGDVVGEVAAPGWTVFTSTRGESPGDRHVIATDSGVWVASGGGLLRWTPDGRITKYTTADGLAFHDIQAMTQDSAGNLWLAGGSDHPGVMRLTLAPDGSLASVDYFHAGTGGLRSNDVWTLLPQPGGALLAGTYDTYLEWWDGTRWTDPPIPTADPALRGIGDRAWALLRTPDGTWWAGGPQGLARTTGGAWESVPLPGDLAGGDYSAYNVAYLFYDTGDGSIWTDILTEPDYEDHIWRLVPQSGAWTWETTNLPEAPSSFLRASDGSLWIVTYDAITHTSPDGTSETITQTQVIPSEYFLDIAEDPDGSIWLTTDSALVHRVGRRWQAYSVDNEPAAHDAVDMLEAPDGALWFVTGYGRLLTYQDGVWSSPDSLDTDTYAMTRQGDALWLATGSGLVRWEHNARRRYAIPDGLNNETVLSLAFDPTYPDLLWFGTLDGLHVLNTADDSVTAWTRAANDLPGPGIKSLYFDDQGTLWVGTAFDDDWIGPGEAVLLRLPDRGDLANLQWEVAASQDDPFDGDWGVETITQDDQGALWIGTDEFAYHQENGRWRRYTGQDGAPEEVAFPGIAITGGITWFATPYYGLYGFDRRGWFPVEAVAENAGYIAGLHVTSDGALWILTETGIVRLLGDPRSAPM